ncbi:MAG: substrate-binding periplasmic protein, partial [Candidatus Binataceae bacterium]
MRLRTGISGLAIVFILIGGVAPRASAQVVNFQPVNPGYLTVATHGSLVPEIVVGPGDQLGGVDGALFNAFATDHGLKLRLFQTTFASMILAVEQHKVDVGEGVFYTPERAKHVYYTYPFYVSHAAIFTLKSFPYSGPSSMKGKRVGTVIGYVWAPYLQTWSAAGAALFPDEVTVGKALLNGQIDGYINGEGVIHAAPFKDAPNVVAHRLHTGDFGMPESALANLAYNIVTCNNRGVAAALNQGLAKLHAKGEWQKNLAANGLG